MTIWIKKRRIFRKRKLLNKFKNKYNSDRAALYIFLNKVFVIMV